MTITIESWRKPATKRIREAICKLLEGCDDGTSTCPVCKFVKNNYGIEAFQNRRSHRHTPFNCRPSWYKQDIATRIGITEFCPARDSCRKFCNSFDLITKRGRLNALKRIYKDVAGKPVPKYFVCKQRRVYT